MSTHKYRPDIDGLRAVAVLGVVASHFQLPGLDGGFVGVDVFFVISGFLITGIIKTKIEDQSFTLAEFYSRRVRRILPALIFVLSVTMSAGWFFLLPGDYSDLAKSAIAASLGVGNLFFFLNTGYFDQVAELQLLLHTWSLGVEEQFYLAWPVFLILCYRMITTNVSQWMLLLLLSFAGFVAAVILTHYFSRAAFYLPPARAWELALGGAMAFAPKLKPKPLAELGGLVGLMFIVGSYLVLDRLSTFPGLGALLPCLGAALIVWPKVSRTVVSYTLGWGPIVGIGLISYSLYLWHWPILSYFKHFAHGRQPEASEAIALLSLSLALSVLTWRFVEQPFRRTLRQPVQTIGIGGLAVLICCIPAAIVIITNGVTSRLPAEARSVASLEVMWDWSCDDETDVLGTSYCTFGTSPWEEAEIRVFLWGDSFAEHLAPLLESIAPEGTAILLYRECLAIANKMVWISGVYSSPSFCHGSHERALEYLSENSVHSIVLAGAWTSRIPSLNSDDYTERNYELFEIAVRRLLERINMQSVYFVSDLPTLPSGVSAQCFVETGLVRSACERVTGLSREEVADLRTSIDSSLGRATSSGATVIYPTRSLCADFHCAIQLDGEFLYRDSGHFRRNLSEGVNVQLAQTLGLDVVFKKMKY